MSDTTDVRQLLRLYAELEEAEADHMMRPGARVPYETVRRLLGDAMRALLEQREAPPAAQGVTPGPWKWRPDLGNFIVAGEHDDLIVAEVDCCKGNPADGEFIARVCSAALAAPPAEALHTAFLSWWFVHHDDARFFNEAMRADRRLAGMAFSWSDAGASDAGGSGLPAEAQVAPPAWSDIPHDIRTRLCGMVEREFPSHRQSLWLRLLREGASLKALPLVGHGLPPGQPDLVSGGLPSGSEHHSVSSTSGATGMPWTRCRQCGEPEHGSIPCALARPPTLDLSDMHIHTTILWDWGEEPVLCKRCGWPSAPEVKP